MDHTTPVSVLVPLTVALNCCVALRFTVGAAGATETDSVETIVAVVLLDLVALAWLVAVTVTVGLAGRSFGAV